MAGKTILSKSTGWWDGHRWQSVIGDMSHAIALERFGAWLSPRILWRVETAERVVALSFDDGPHPEFTPSILDILDRRKIPATFFLVGRHVRREPALARRLAGGAHEIANHTLNHLILPALPDRVVIEEIRQADQAIGEITGRSPRLLRPPMGLFSRRVIDLIEGCGYTTVIGDVYPRDPNLPGRERIYRRVIQRVRPGSIIIMHDGGNSGRVDRSQTVWAVERIVENLCAQNYRFVTISEMVEMGSGRNGSDGKSIS